MAEGIPTIDRAKFASRCLRLGFQIYRRGFVMMHWQIEEIVKRRLMRDLFRHWRKERNAVREKGV